MQHSPRTFLIQIDTRTGNIRMWHPRAICGQLSKPMVLPCRCLNQLVLQQVLLAQLDTSATYSAEEQLHQAVCEAAGGCGGM